MSDVNGIDEIDAMKQVGSVLKDLDPEATRRVLAWANDRFGQFSGRPMTADATPKLPSTLAGATSRFPEQLADMYGSASPETEADRALVVACWIQFVRGDADFDAQSVNRELKHLGDGVGNITQALSQLMEQKPQLVIQMRKNGTSRQARKRYKVTAAGRKAVEARISTGGGE